MLTNELPRIADVSGALASRFIVLRLTKSFFGHEDHTLTDRLLRELPGILNWSIQGWERLQERGHFLQPESGGQLAQSLEDLGSPLSAFVRARCEIGSGKLVMIEQLHSEYCSWCHEHHHVPPPDVQTFGRDLRSVLPTIQTKQRRVEGKQVLHYIGIGLR